MLASQKKQAGLGLIEIMISISISIFILSGVLQLWATARGNSATNQGQATIQDNLRYIVSQLERDASQVGGAGCFSQAFRMNEKYLGSILDNSAVTTPGLARFDINLFVNGSDDSGLLNTDTVLLRSAPGAGIPVQTYSRSGSSSNQITLDISTPYAQRLYSQIQQFDVLLASDCTSAVFFMVTDVPTNNGVLTFKANVIASSGVNAGFQNRPGSGTGTARLEDEGSLTDFEDNVAVSDWDGNSSGSIISTRPYVYLTSASNTAVYSIGNSERATDLTAFGEPAQCAADSPQYCALLRNGVEIAEGVVDFQIEYGWHVGGDEQGALRFGNAAQASGNFNNVDRIRFTLQLNGLGSGNQQGDITRTYTRTVALRNQIGN